MAQTSIRVSVLEGCYSHLLAVGVPLPLCIHSQELGVVMDSAQWTAKQSSSGFSVSFFWPAPVPAGRQPFRPGVPKPRRRRRKKKCNVCPSKEGTSVTAAQEVHVPSATLTAGLSDVPDCGTPASDVLSLAGDLPPPSTSAENDSAVSASSISGVVAPVERLSDAHPETSHSEDNLEDEVSSSESLDLMSCEAVALDVRDVPGVSFVKDGVEQWSPVVSRRRRARPMENSSSSDGSDLDLTNCQATYHTLNGTPGVACKFGRSRTWTPIAARTRHKKKRKKT